MEEHPFFLKHPFRQVSVLLFIHFVLGLNIRPPNSSIDLCLLLCLYSSSMLHSHCFTVHSHCSPGYSHCSYVHSHCSAGHTHCFAVHSHCFAVHSHCSAVHSHCCALHSPLFLEDSPWYSFCVCTCSHQLVSPLHSQSFLSLSLSALCSLALFMSTKIFICLTNVLSF